MTRFEDIKIETGMVGLRRDCKLIHFFWHNGELYFREEFLNNLFYEQYDSNGEHVRNHMRDIIKLYSFGAVPKEEVEWCAFPIWERYKGAGANG